MKNLDMLDIEDILYDGTKEKIEEVLKKYQIYFNYDGSNFNFKSSKLLQISKGNNSEKKPNCVVYFGNEYNYKN